MTGRLRAAVADVWALVPGWISDRAADLAERHQPYRNRLGDSSGCCDETCECHSSADRSTP